MEELLFSHSITLNIPSILKSSLNISSNEIFIDYDVQMISYHISHQRKPPLVSEMGLMRKGNTAHVQWVAELRLPCMSRTLLTEPAAVYHGCIYIHAV